VAEVLNKLTVKASNMGLFQGLQVGRRREKLTHLQFADDTLLFCEANELYLQGIKRALLSFQTYSGLAVNYSKSAVLVFGKDEEWANEIARQLECRLVKLPITYLGVPLGANMRKMSSWQGVIDKIQNRLNTWKGTCISRAGRVVLIKAVLSSLPTYYLSLFKLPTKVAQEINKIQRRFLWSGQKSGRYSALVKWELIQKPKDKGGLGVADCTLKNAALLFKWWWRYACEEGCLWRRIVDSIHEDELVIMPDRNRRSLTGTWNDIRRMATLENPVTKAFFQQARVQLGDGERIKFWQDTCAGQTPLQTTFPSLYRVSAQQKELVSNMGWFEGDIWRWVLSWKRILTEEESQAEIALNNILHQHYPRRDTRDKLNWGRGGHFSVKDLYRKATSQREEGVTVYRLLCSVWQKVAPLRWN